MNNSIQHSAVQSFAKRAFDIFTALLLLLVSLPLSLLAVVGIWLSMGGPVLFPQKRPGLFCKAFTLMKFRTMAGASVPGREAIDDRIRLTSFGKFLRRTSIDEIPQLINVLRGDMSMIGPRPLLTDYLSLYSDAQRCRHNVRPGITGWAQVKGRNALSWEEKFRLDIWYVDNWSLMLDVKILLLTVRQVILGTGINSDSQVTMVRFTGNK